MRKLLSVVLPTVFAVVFTVTAHPAAADERERQRIIAEMFEVMEYDAMIASIGATVGRQIAADIGKQLPNADAAFLAEVQTIWRSSPCGPP